MSPRRASSIPRLLTVALMLLSWLAVTNHCVLARMHPVQSAEESIPACHQAEHAPKKEAPCHEMTQCCGSVKASVSSKAEVKFDTSKFQLQAFAILQVLARPAEPEPGFWLDHGPPDAVSFAELVLQRSVLSHAPPFGV